jgi:hypothetical protein
MSAPGKLARAALVLLVSACAVAPPKPVLERAYDVSFKQSVDLMVRQADTCWRRDYSAGRDGILVEVERRAPVAGTLQLSVSRVAPGTGVRPAFFKMEITGMSATRTQVRVAEGDYGLGSRLNLSGDVARWFAGDVTCRPL